MAILAIAVINFYSSTPVPIHTINAKNVHCKYILNWSEYAYTYIFYFYPRQLGPLSLCWDYNLRLVRVFFI